MAGIVLFTDMKPYFHFLLSTHGWSSEGLPTIEELTVSQATPEKKSTDKSPSRIQDLLSGDAFTITLKHVTIQTPPLSGWKRELCTNFWFGAFTVCLWGGGSLYTPKGDLYSSRSNSASFQARRILCTILESREPNLNESLPRLVPTLLVWRERRCF